MIGRHTIVRAFVAMALIAVGNLGRLDRTASAQESTSTFSIGSTEHSLNFDGVERTYRIYRPATLPASAPLVVMMHGGGGSGANAERAFGWDREADSGHFVVAYPDGLNNVWNTEGGCCGKSARDGVDDAGFISEMVQEIDASISIDPLRVFATGMSNGGMMTYTLACTTSLFATIGPVSAAMLNDCPSPEPISVIHIHGTADTNVPFDGSRGTGVAKIQGPSIPDLIASWSAIDQCGKPVVTSEDPVTTSIAQCADGRIVELITIAGAGHDWPGSIGANPNVPRGPNADPVSTAIDATEVIWTFFSAHPKK
jgi:polyhydroxybutyrate depolymerase